MPVLTLLTLPLDIRFQIYHHLTSYSPLSYPFGHTPITSITHRPPPTALQHTCRALHHEVTHYFYGLATLRLVTQEFQRVYAAEHYTACLPAVRRAKKVEIVLVWEDYRRRAVGDEGTWLRRMKESLMQAVELLRDEGKCLEVVIVSVRVAGGALVSCDVGDSILAPLKDIAGRVQFVLGEVTVPKIEGGELRECLVKHLRGLNSTGR